MTAPSRLARALLLALAGGACVLAALSSRDLWPPDEPRYGQVAREMLERGDPLVPHRGGKPYAEKPPVYFWIAAALSAPGGRVTPITARLAAALFAAGAVWLTFRIARLWFQDDRVATLAALFFGASGVVLWYGPRAGLDMPLTFFVLAAVERLSVWARTDRLLPAVVGGIAWALAVLVKGPLGLLVPPLVIAGGMLASRRVPRPSNPGWWLAPLVLAAVGLAWLLPALHAGGDAYSSRLLGQLLTRASGEGEGHVRPLPYYAVRSAYLLLPFSLYLLAGLHVLLRPRSWRPGHRFGLGAALAGGPVMLLLLSLVATKREQYLLPLVPFIALPGAVAVRAGIPSRLLRLSDRAMGPLLLVLGAGALATPWLVRARLPRGGVPAFDGPSPWVIAAASLVALPLVTGGMTLLRTRRDTEGVIRRTAASMLAAAVVLHVAVLPFLDPTKSYARVAAAANATRGEGGVAYGWFNQPGNLLWNLGTLPLRPIEDAEALAAALAPDAPRVAVVMEERHWERLRREARASTPDRSAVFERARVAWEDPARRRRLVVVTNAGK